MAAILPVALVQPVVVKNTFLDLDDNYARRTSRRCKSETSIDIRTAIDIDCASTRSTTTPTSSNGDAEFARAHADSVGSTEAFQIPCQFNGTFARIASSSYPDDKRNAPHDVFRKAPASYSWNVDRRKLRSNDRSVVSQPFTLAFGDPSFAGMTCKMMIFAKAKDSQQGHSFKDSNGYGSLQLKCEHDLIDPNHGEVLLRFAVGGGQSRFVRHDFSKNAVCMLSKWNFGKAVSKNAPTFVIRVEVANE